MNPYEMAVNNVALAIRKTDANAPAIDGVTLNLLKQSPLGLEQGLTIGVDQANYDGDYVYASNLVDPSGASIGLIKSGNGTFPYDTPLKATSRPDSAFLALSQSVQINSSRP